jgi:streptogramin lyase
MFGKDRQSRKQADRSAKRQTSPRRLCRPRLEPLEDRTLLTAYFPQVPGALDTILNDLNSAVNQQVWAASPALPILGSALTTNNPPSELQFHTSTIKSKLDTEFNGTTPNSYQDVVSDVKSALGALVTNIVPVNNDPSTTDLSQSNNVEFKVTLVQDVTVPVSVKPTLDLHLPQMGLTLQSPPTVNITYGYNFEFDFGVTQNDVYLDTSPNPEIAVHISASPSSFQTSATLGTLGLSVGNGTPGTNLQATFSLDVTGGNVSVNNTLNGNPAFFSQNSTPTFGGDGQISLAMKLATAGFPTITGNLFIDWPFSGDPNTGNAPSVKLTNVQADASSFLTSAVGPVAQDIQDALKPLTPIVDTLNTEIPIISSLPGLGGLTFAKFIDDAGNTGGTVQAFINTYLALSNLTNYTSSATISLGDYGFASYDPRNQALSSAAPSLVNAPSTSIQDQINGASGLGDLYKLTGPGSLPIFINPSGNAPNAVGALLGQDYLHLFQYTLPQLTLDKDPIPDPPIFIPILGPLGVTLAGKVGLHTDFTFGWDTHGLVTSDVSNGFFVSQADVALTLGVNADAAINLGVAEAGAGGGISANITFGLNHPNGPDVHESDIEKLHLKSPYALFSVDGDLEVGLNAFLKIGIGPFSVTFSVDLGHITLLNFNWGPGGQPTQVPDLGDVKNGTLYLNMGPRACLRGNVNNSDTDPEVFHVSHVSGSPDDPGGETVDVEAFGYIQQIPGVHHIYAEGGEGNNTIMIDQASKKDPGVLSSVKLYAQYNPVTEKPDQLQYQTDPLSGATETHNVLRAGTGCATLMGGVGNDILQGGLGNNTLTGGDDNGGLDGGEVLIGGKRHNVLTGGTSRYQDFRAATVRLVAGPQDGDVLVGGQGHTIFVAGAGHDTFFGGTGKNEFIWQAPDGNVDIYAGNSTDNTLGVTGNPNGNSIEVKPGPTSGPPEVDIVDSYAYTTQTQVINMTSNIAAHGSMAQIDIGGNIGSNTYQIDDLSGMFTGSLYLSVDKRLLPTDNPDSIIVKGAPSGNTVDITAQSVFDPQSRTVYELDNIALNNYAIAAYLPTEADSVEVDAGPGDNTITVDAGAGPTIINAGGGTNTINVDVWAAATADITIEAGSGANNQLNFGINPQNPDEVLGGVPSNITLTDSELDDGITGYLPIKYRATGGTFGRGITLTTAGNGGHTVYVNSILAGAPTTINTSDDHDGATSDPGKDYGDHVIVGGYPGPSTLSQIAAPLTVHGRAETVNGNMIYEGALSIFDSDPGQGESYDLLNNELIRDGASPIYYDTFRSLDLSLSDAGNNTCLILGTPALTTVTVNAGTRFDRISVINPDESLDEYPGPLTINGQGPTIVEFGDRGNTNYSTWTVQPARVLRAYRGPSGTPVVADFQYNNGIAGVILDGGPGGSEFDLGTDFNNLNLLPTVTANGGGPSDTVVVDDQHSPGPAQGSPDVWNISGASASRTAYEGPSGSPSGTTTVNYSNIQNLTINANALSNSFVLSPNVQNLDELPANVNIMQPLGGTSAILLDDIHNGAHADPQGNTEPTQWRVTNTSVTRAYTAADGTEIVRNTTFDTREDAVTVLPGTADDSILLQPGPDSSGFRLLPVNVSIIGMQGGQGNASLRLEDTQPDDAGAFPHRYTLEHASIVRALPSSSEVISYANLSRLEIDGDPQSQFTVLDTAANTTTVLRGGGGGGTSFAVGGQAAINGPIQLSGNGSGNVLTRIAPFDEFSLPGNQDRGLGTIVPGPDGALWFLETTGNTIGRMAADGSFSEFPLPANVVADDLIEGHDNSLWFIDGNANQIDRFNVFNHRFDTVFTADAGYALTSLAATVFDSWFIESGGGRSIVGSLDLSGAVTETPVAEFARNLTIGPDPYSVWFEEFLSPVSSVPDHLGQITEAGTYSQVPFALPPTNAKVNITSFTNGPDGNLWATATLTTRFRQTGEILKISTSGQVQTFGLSSADNTVPGQITAGPDGNLWFINDDIDQGLYYLGFITPSGSIQEFDLPSEFPGSVKDAYSITAGPNQSLWFTEPNANQVGEFLIPQQPAVWQITGPNSGSLYSNVQLDHIGTLSGGPGDDQFQFENGGTIAGSVVGGLGNSVLDFSQTTSSTTISGLASGSLKGYSGNASPQITGGGFDNIDTIIGNSVSVVVIDDSTNTNATSWNLSANGVVETITPPGSPSTTITRQFSNFGFVVINAGSGANSFTVHEDFVVRSTNTAPGVNVPIEFDLSSLSASNSLSMVDDTGLVDDMVLNASALTTQVRVPALEAAGEDASLITVNLSGLQFSNGVALHPDAASTVEVFGNPANTSTTVTGTSDDTFTVGDASRIQGSVYLHGGSGTNTLIRGVPPPNLFPIPTSNSDARGITMGPDGAEWFTEFNANKLGRITPDGTVTEYGFPGTGPALGPVGPTEIVKGPDGRLYFIGANVNMIFQFDPVRGVITHEFAPLPTGPFQIISNLVSGPGPYVWFSASSSGRYYIGQLNTTSGAIQLFLVQTNEMPGALADGPDGNLWFVETTTSRVTNYVSFITPLGQETDMRFPRFDSPAQPGDSAVTSMTAGPDGNLWATVSTSGQMLDFLAHEGTIVEINTQGKVVHSFAISGSPFDTLDNIPTEIVKGPDGNLWFSDMRSTNSPAPTSDIALITPTGHIQGFNDLTNIQGLNAITAGPDGIWFTQYAALPLGGRLNDIGLVPIPTQPSPWQINSPNAGRLYNNVYFAGVQNLSGGLGGDNFQFQRVLGYAGSLSGALTGGFSTSGLDYSQYSGVPVSVTGTGTFHGFKGTAGNIAGGFDNIDFIKGGVRQINDQTSTVPTTWIITSSGVSKLVAGLLTADLPFASLGSFTGLEIDGGSGGNTFDILSTAAGIPLTINGSGSSGDKYVFGDSTHTLTDLQGPITLNPGSGANSLVVDASGTPIPIHWLVDFSSSLMSGLSIPALDASSKDPGLMAIHLSNTAQFLGGTNLVTGSQAENANIKYLPANSPLTVTGAGTGTITAGGDGGLDAIHSTVNVDAPSALMLDDRVDQRPAIYTVTGTSVTFNHPPSIFWSGPGDEFHHNPTVPATILGGGGGNTFSVLSSVEGGHATSFVTGGNDVVNVGDNGSVQGILGPISIVGTGATLVVDDSADPTPRTFTITPTTITGLAPAVITYSGVSNLTVDGGYGGNTIAITNTAAGTDTTVNSGNGVDVVYVEATTGPLTVDTQESGPVIPGGGGIDSVIVGLPGAVGDTLDQILGPLTIDNVTGARPGIDRADLGLYDTAETAPENWLLTGDTILRSGMAPIHYRVSNELFFFLGSGGNNGQVTTMEPGLSTVFLGGTGNDVFEVGDAANTLNGITFYLSIQTSSPGSRIILNDQGTTSPANYTFGSFTQSGRTFGDVVRSVAGQATGEIIYTAPLQSLTLNGGTGGDTYNLQDTLVPIFLQSPGPDIVNVGAAGSVQGIQGALSVASGGATMVVDDSADPTPRTFTLSPTTITGLSPAAITYSGVANLTVDGGYGGNLIGVTNTAAGTTTTLNSGNGVDTVYVRATTGPLTVNTQQSNIGPGFGGFEAVIVGQPTALGFTLDGIQGALTVNRVARPGMDYGDLALYDTGATSGENYTMTSNTFLRSGAAPIYYSVTNELFSYLGSGGNTFNVQSMRPALAYAIFGGVGNDTFNIGDTNNTLNGIIYQLVISVQNPGSQVILNDQGSSANYGYALAEVTLHPTIAINLPAYRILRSDWDSQGRGASIYVAGPLYGSPPLPLQSLQLNAGSGNDTFNVQSLPPGNPTVTLVGGSGANTLQGPNQSNAWQVTGANAGSLDANIKFANVQNLIGGSSSDAFAFKTGGRLAGKLDGGAGINTLNYSAYVGDVTVDLPLAVATGIAGGIANIENVTGSQGNDLLVGDANPNVLIGGTGRSVIIGGGGPDQITGGSGDNLLIGGTTSYDMNLAALQAIAKVWDNPTLAFDLRVNLLRKGTTVNGQAVILGKSTVQNDGAPDNLVGGAGLNWFIVDSDDTINNGRGPGLNDRLTRI